MNEKKAKSLGKRFFNDSVPSNYGYPEGFTVKSVEKQVMKISRIFGLNPKESLIFCESLPNLKNLVPEDYLYDIEYYAIPKLSVIQSRFSGCEESCYCKASILVLSELSGDQNLKFFPEKITKENFKLNSRTKKFIEKIERSQNGDIVILPCSFGLIHRGKCSDMVKSHFFPKEFGLDVFYTSCMSLTNKLRYQKFDALGVDCLGTEYFYEEEGEIFEETPIIRITQGKKYNQKFLEINSRSIYQGCAYQGAATGFYF